MKNKQPNKEEFTKDVLSGMTLKNLAKKYGFSSTTARNYMSRWDIVKPQFLETEAGQYALEQYKNGVPAAKIARLLDIPVTRIKKAFSENGIKNPRRVADGKKFCSECKTRVPLQNFSSNGTSSLGGPKYMTVCRDCHTSYRKRLKELRRAK